MTRTYPYTTSESGNIIVVKTGGGLLIAIGDQTYLTDDPSDEPMIGTRKTVTVEEDGTIDQILKKIRGNT